MVDFGTGERINRFVCPNDRQLALRAKLNTGWSVKTATLGYSHKVPQSSPLAAEEQDAIVQVIQRAEQLDMSEQQRIGKLVEKLDSMRRNALGKNAAQCLLCGDNFGILGAQKIVCMDCRRLACTKCSIDTLAGRGPRHAYQPQSKKPQLLVSLLFLTKRSKVKVKRLFVSSTAAREHWLCMICAETREMWKKSGAWFYKSIPKYVLPVDNSRFNRSKSVRASRRYKDDDSSSDEERRLWGRRKRANSSTESALDAIEQDQHNYHNNLPGYNYYSRQNSSGESQVSREMDSLKTQVSSMTLNETKSWEEAGSDSRQDMEGSQLSRRDSMATKSLSDWNNWSPDNRTEDKISPSTSSINSSIFKTTNEEKAIDTSMGVIELSLTYDQETNTLHCTVYRAKNLISMDMAGLSDPFCKLNILPNAKMSTRLRTKTVHKTRNPEFNENLTFYDISESDLMKKSLHILVVDDDKYGHDYMGETRMKLAKLKYQNTIYILCKKARAIPQFNKLKKLKSSNHLQQRVKQIFKVTLGVKQNGCYAAKKG